MTLDLDHGFGLLSPEDQEKIKLILTERSDGSYGAPDPTKREITDAEKMACSLEAMRNAGTCDACQ